MIKRKLSATSYLLDKCSFAFSSKNGKQGIPQDCTGIMGDRKVLGEDEEERKIKKLLEGGGQTSLTKPW